MRRIILSLGLVALVTLSARQLASVPSESQSKIIEFETMVGVSGPFVGTRNPIRTVSGGGAPWVIGSGQGELETDGSLKVQVRGLVLAGRRINPLANFRAIVSCRSIGSAGQPTVVNVSTDNFLATPEGDSDIEATVNLPSPCIAPIIFVTSPTGAWFAATGH